MSTIRLTINTATWIKVADANDTDFLVSWDVARFVDFASTELDELPTIKGHRISREKVLTREELGAGYIWAKLVPAGGSSEIALTLSKTKSNSGATGGFDSIESVHKVAMLVWNADLLSWERATSTGGTGGSGGETTTRTKRFEKVDDTLMYIGEAVVGSTEGASVWLIKKIIFDTDGNATSLLVANGSWTSRNSLSYG